MPQAELVQGLRLEPNLSSLDEYLESLQAEADDLLPSLEEAFVALSISDEVVPGSKHDYAQWPLSSLRDHWLDHGISQRDFLEVAG